jgi:membrane protease YdiL (CAAX protease family)
MQPLDAENAWVASANAARRHIPGSIALVIAILTFAFTLWAAPAIYAFAVGVLDLNLSVGGARLARSLAYFLPLNGVTFVLVFLLFERRSWPQAKSLWFFFGVFAGAAAFVLTLAVVIAFGVVRYIDESPLSPRLVAGIVEAVFIIGLRAFGEELFFRAWLQPLLVRSWGASLAVAATSVFFGLAHALSRDVPFLVFVNVSLAGAFFGLLALRTGGLAAPFAAHWVWNAVEQCLLGLTPNPGSDPMGTVFNLDLVGPHLLSGGADGLNGSIGNTAALIVCVAALGAAGAFFVDRPHAAGVR